MGTEQIAYIRSIDAIDIEDAAAREQIYQCIPRIEKEYLSDLVENLPYKWEEIHNVIFKSYMTYEQWKVFDLEWVSEGFVPLWIEEYHINDDTCPVKIGILVDSAMGKQT